MKQHGLSAGRGLMPAALVKIRFEDETSQLLRLTEWNSSKLVAAGILCRPRHKQKIVVTIAHKI